MVDWDAVVVGPLMRVFGEPVNYTPQDAPAFQIAGVFDDAYLKEHLFDDATTGVTTVSACLGVQLSQFGVAPAQNDALLVVRTGASYLVREVRVDSRGGARLLLSKVSPP